jgi:hypothetical protein
MMMLVGACSSSASKCNNDVVGRWKISNYKDIVQVLIPVDVKKEYEPYERNYL